MTETMISTIDEIFATNTRSALEQFSELYALLKGDNDQAPALMKLIMEKDMRLNETPEKSEANKKLLFDPSMLDCRRITQQIVIRLSNLNEKEDVFYAHLWELLNSSCYNSDDERSFALFCIASNVRLPYYQIGQGLMMSDEKYQEITREVFNTVLCGIQIILKRHGLQSTQTASLLLEQIDRLEDKEKKVVFLSQVMQYFSEEITNRLGGDKSRDE